MKKLFLFAVIIGVTILIIKAFEGFEYGLAPNNQVCIVDFPDVKYKSDILAKFIDSFLLKHQEYDAIKRGHKLDTSLSFLPLRQIYSNSPPFEIYTIRVDYPICIRTVDYLGTGTSLTFHANDLDKEMKENESEISRVTNRFKKEILSKVIESIELSNSRDNLK